MSAVEEAAAERCGAGGRGHLLLFGDRPSARPCCQLLCRFFQRNARFGNCFSRPPQPCTPPLPVHNTTGFRSAGPLSYTSLSSLFSILRLLLGVELLDALRIDLRHRLIIKDQPLLLVLLDPADVVPSLGRSPLVRDHREELVAASLVVAALGAVGPPRAPPAPRASWA